MIRGSLAQEDRTDRRARAFMLHVLWGGSGFVAGVVFWHFVGFWSLVQSAVFGHADIPLAAQVTRERIETGSLPERAADGCVTLVRHGATGETRSTSCEVTSVQLLDRGMGRKDDRAAGAATHRAAAP